MFKRLFNPPLPLGTETKWGDIQAIHSKDGERSYMMTRDGVVSLMPADIVEASVKE